MGKRGLKPMSFAMFLRLGLDNHRAIYENAGF
jgi:hypothetical protein